MTQQDHPNLVLPRVASDQPSRKELVSSQGLSRAPCGERGVIGNQAGMQAEVMRPFPRCVFESNNISIATVRIVCHPF